jgi:hypothetical protein
MFLTIGSTLSKKANICKLIVLLSNTTENIKRGDGDFTNLQQNRKKASLPNFRITAMRPI